jgi:preprotein translocase subunit SecD
MKCHWQWFNTYLMAALALALVCGCHTTPESQRKKLRSTLRVHVESTSYDTNRVESVSIPRTNPVHFIVEKSPILTEGNVKEAKVIETTGGFALQIQFDRRGTWLWEEVTGGNRGKHFAVFCQFMADPKAKLGKGRWLAAPKVYQRVANGQLVFTPDATREEADLIATGFNNVAKKLKTGEGE